MSDEPETPKPEIVRQGTGEVSGKKLFHRRGTIMELAPGVYCILNNEGIWKPWSKPQ